MLIITSKQHGFRRCGVAHPAEPTEHADGTFTPEQIKILHNEPMLVVLEADGGKSNEDTDPGKPPGKLPAAVAIAAARAADSIDVLGQMAEGETRKTVLDAIEARRKGLEDEKIAQVKSADKEELAKLAEGETRAAVQEAIIARSQELEA